MGFWEFRHSIMRLWTSSMTAHPRFNSVLFNKLLPTTRRQNKNHQPTMSWNNASTFQSKLHDQVVGQINTPRFHQKIIQMAGCMVKKILVLLRGKLRHSHLHEAIKHSQSSKFNPRYWGTEMCLRSLIPWMVINFTQGLVDDVFSFLMQNVITWHSWHALVAGHL